MFKKLLGTAVLATSLIAGNAMAADYAIDKPGQHAFVNFKISHLGISWMYGSFKDFDGTFSYDETKPEASKVAVTLKTNSVDTNHAERDKHIRSGDFLNVSKFPEAKFVSTKVTKVDDKKIDVTGDLTIHGVTKQVVVNAELTGQGNDPWGGYRAGFLGTTNIKMSDFGIKNILGEASENIELTISLEGVRK